jgi:hypothetical protein
MQTAPNRRVDLEEQDVELVNFDRSIWLDHSGPRSLVPADSAPGFSRCPNNAGSAIGQPKFNNAWLSFESIRFGGGLRLKVAPFASLQAEGGYEAARNFNFYNLNNTNGINAHVKSAPYIATKLNISF